MNILKATTADVRAMHEILTEYADRGLLLARPLSELYDHLRDYYVIKDEGENDVLGVCALGICWEDLAEIRSLAVREAWQGRGYGVGLIHACLEEARVLQLKRVFTLSYIPEFFEKAGFKVVEKSVLPHKIWADCLKCPKFPDCDETALMLEL
jgi:amino-acid N-acetyltransferase